MSEDVVLVSTLNQLNYAALFKPVVSLFLILYILFALIMVRQVGLMSTVLGTNLCPILKVVAYLHLIAAGAVLLITLVAL